MATIEQHLNGAWRTKIRRNGYPTLSATFDTKAEAQRWAAEIEGDMSRARFVGMREAESTTLEEARDRYSREVTAAKKGAKQEMTRIAKWKKYKLAKKGLAAIRSPERPRLCGDCGKHCERARERLKGLRLCLAIGYTESARIPVPLPVFEFVVRSER